MVGLDAVLHRRGVKLGGQPFAGDLAERLLQELARLAASRTGEALGRNGRSALRGNDDLDGFAW